MQRGGDERTRPDGSKEGPVVADLKAMRRDQILLSPLVVKTESEGGNFFVDVAPPRALDVETRVSRKGTTPNQVDVFLATEADFVDFSEQDATKAFKKACPFSVNAQAALFLAYPVVDIVNAFREGNGYSAARIIPLVIASTVIGGAVALTLGETVASLLALKIAEKTCGILLGVAAGLVSYYVGDKTVSLVRFFQSCRDEDAPSTSYCEKMKNLFRPTNNPSRS